MNKFKHFIRIIKKIFYVLFLLIKNFFLIFPLLFRTLKFITSNFFSRFKRLFRFSITFKITTVYAFIFSLIIFTLSGLILLGFKHFLTYQAHMDIEKNSQLIIDEANNNFEIPYGLINNTASINNFDITIFNNNGELFYSTIKNTNEIEFYNIPYLSNIEDAKNHTKMLLSKKFNLNNYVYYIQIAKNLTTDYTYINMVFHILFILDIIGIIIVLLIGSKTSKKMLLPIDTMTNTVKQITVKNLDTRLNVKGSHDELKDLAETFNQMFDRLQNAYEHQNQFVSDASHELRTPIAVIQGYANLLHRWGKNNSEVLEESITAIKNESENMKELVEKLLFLARADKKTQKVEKSIFYLNELIDEVIKETNLIDTSHEIISLKKETVQILADPKLLKQTLRIFIDNSLKFTPENGQIIINSFKQKNKAVIEITDTGIGIPKEDIPYIFNRFYRSDKSRSKEKGGTGLGLSIAKWVIGKHDGSISVESKINSGTKMIISLPINI